MLALSLFSSLVFLVRGENLPCEARDFGHSSIVCVCNSTYCDTYDKIEAATELVGWVSDRKGSRLEQYSVGWTNSSETVGVTISLNRLHQGH